MVLLCLMSDVDITRFANSLQLHFAVFVLSCFNQSLLQIFWKDRIFAHYQVGPPCRFCSATNINPEYILQIIVEKKDIMTLLIKWVLLMIRFIVWVTEVLMLLFWDCLNVMRFYQRKFIKLCCLLFILCSILETSHVWWSDGFLSIGHPIILQSKLH